MTREDADKILAELRDKSIFSVRIAIDYLLNQPQIIYCKDCKNNFLGDCPIKSGYEGGWFKYTNCDSDFCSYGEKRE